MTATHFTVADLMLRTLAEGVSGHKAWRACVDHDNENYDNENYIAPDEA